MQAHWSASSITMAFGVLTVFVLPDWPRNTRWLNDSERLLAQQRMAEDASAADEDLTGASFLHGFNLAVKDKVVWIFCLATFCQLTGLSYTNFFPSKLWWLGCFLYARCS